MFPPIPRKVRNAVEDATRAVSIHNCQPWVYVAPGEQVEVWLDPTSSPRVVDPEGRWLVQSIGATVAVLELALAHRLGERIEVEQFPDRGFPCPSLLVRHPLRDLAPSVMEMARRPLAVLTWHGVEEQGQADRQLYDAVPYRFTSRAPFASVRVSQRHWHDVLHATRVGEAVAGEATAGFALDFLSMTARADDAWASNADYLAELEEWVGRRTRDGIRTDAVGVRDRSGRVTGRDFSRGLTHGDQRSEHDFERDSELIVIHTDTDTPRAWLEAGRAMQRAALRATASGLRVGILGQALEDPVRHREVSQSYSRRLGRDVVVQQVFRLGHGDGSPRPGTSPRKALKDVLCHA